MFGISNPNRLLQPWKNLGQFTQELYAMFSSNEPVQHDGPVTIQARPDQTALKLVRGEDALPPPGAATRARNPTSPSSPPRTSPAAPGQSVASKVYPSPGEPPQAPGRRNRPAAIPPGFAGPKRPLPLLSVDGPAEFKGSAPVQFSEPPQILNKQTGQFETPEALLPSRKPLEPESPIKEIPPILPVFAVVTGGTGSTWDMKIKTEEDDGDDITVTIPMIADDETAPVGFGMPVFLIGDTYYGQPPIWLD